MNTPKLLGRIAVIAALTGAVPALAQDVDNDPNITIGVTDYLPDGDRNLDNDWGYFFGAEYPLTTRWSVALERFSIDSDVDNSAAKSDVDLTHLGVNYHLNKIGAWQPYVGAGVGTLEIEPNIFGPADIDEDTFDINLGVKRYLGDNFMFRGDVKFIDGSETHETDSLVSLGIAYVFGRRARPVASTPSTPAAVVDSDGDGVPDNMDACANTPRGVTVDRRGCEIDSDRDGVVDSRDNCPDTPTDLMVDANGCPILQVTQRRQELLVNFDFDRSEVKPEYDDEIADFAEFMEVYGNTNVVIEGHTDSVGTDEYNQALSERRANAVRNELVNEHDIDAGRVSAVGYGESRPVTTNATREGRARNRRIEAAVSVDVEEQRRR